ncbi:hypothetical protein FIBSPDRAFT_198690 [Athelia psychrophila]|uniref:GPI anchored protein n=1 Tax=Athelia psychrophila TaxID=1759441 RepID=A0A165ZSD8_9AGAM|nr:hypothetical protein FIBSPDRAFT_198690 [Fibularhizoctonia sp. CBS 109695]
MMSPKLSVLLACMLSAQSALGQVSLYVPGFDPQPLSVNELGAGSDGRTTWEILPGTPTGTFEEAAFFGTATLIEGPSDAVIAYAVPALTLTIAEACGIANGVAVCTAVQNGAATVTETENASAFAVQGGATAVAVTSTAAASSATLTSAATQASGSMTTVLSTSSTSSSSATTASTSSTANGGSRAATTFTVGAAVLGAAGIVMAML